MNSLFDRVIHYSNAQNDNINAANVKHESTHESASIKNIYPIPELKCQHEVIESDHACDTVLEKTKSQLSCEAFKMDVKTNFLKSESANLQKEIEDLSEMLVEILSERDQAALDLDKTEDETKQLEEEVLAMQMEMEEVKYCNDSSLTMIVDQLKMYNQMLLLQKEQEMVELRKMTLKHEELKRRSMALYTENRLVKINAFYLKLEMDEIDKIDKKISFENNELHNTIMITKLENKAENSKTRRLNGARQSFKKLVNKKKMGASNLREKMIEKQRYEPFDCRRKSCEPFIPRNFQKSYSFSPSA